MMENQFFSLERTMIKKASIGILIGIMGLSACSTSSGVKGSAVTQAKNAPSDLANAPVKALNLKNVKIPDYLKNANDPYARTFSTSCADIAAEVAQLDEFLGPDWDSPDHYSKVGGKRGNLFDAILPYGGLVRFVSGASRHEKKVLQAADYAGVRRSYLKTVGQNKGC